MKPFVLSRHTLLIGIVVLWSSSLVIGFGALWSYSLTTHQDGSTEAEVLPASLVGDLPESGPLLVVGAHPKCPCLRATLSELDRLVASVGKPVRMLMLCYVPEGSEASWSSGFALGIQDRYADARVRADVSGGTAAALGMQTAGHVMLFGEDRSLLFSGGITPARGHEGDNFGRQSLKAILTGREPAKTRTPVYGCSLVDEAACGDACVFAAEEVS